MGGRREQPGNKWAGVTKEEGPATRPKFSDGHNLTGFGRMRIAPRRCRGNHCTGWTMAANSASILWPIDCPHYVGDSGIFAAHYRAGVITMSFGETFLEETARRPRRKRTSHGAESELTSTATPPTHWHATLDHPMPRGQRLTCDYRPWFGKGSTRQGRVRVF